MTDGVLSHRAGAGEAELQSAFGPPPPPPAQSSVGPPQPPWSRFLRDSGAAVLLKPALLCVENHRPADPAGFVGHFLGLVDTYLG